jgi:hypothetical protein
MNVDLKSRLDGEFYKAQGRVLHLSSTINHSLHFRRSRLSCILRRRRPLKKGLSVGIRTEVLVWAHGVMTLEQGTTCIEKLLDLRIGN